ncbi:ABC transporter family protein [Tritrichomonas foetus]|uniref:ABC transporter family protein n=1 Tax=Tritrichomonas foetus TaxID=1144522 RepID=A0A1J4L0G3_9EUKA|nr:ABC transporter family protein [Tritrichomonas foetus]|eukprot:OHT16991.1 ABC transporter family protein [Tritrichomonas foetus]
MKSSHFKAIFFRRWVLLKRSWKEFLMALIGTIVASALGIVCNYLWFAILAPKAEKNTFKEFDNPSFAFIDDKTFPDSNSLKTKIENLFLNESNYGEIQSFSFESIENFEKWVINHMRNYDEPESIPLTVGYSIRNFSYFITSYFNVTGFHQVSQELDVEIQASRVLHKYIYGDSSDLNISFITLNTREIEFMFALTAPILIGCGIMTITPLIISQIISDLTGEVRSYMESCSLSILPYWLSTFIVDYCLWLIFVTIAWAIYLAAQIKAFLDNMFTTWYIIAVSGFGIILFMYCLSFCFDSVEFANHQLFLIFFILLLVPFIVEMCTIQKNPVWLEWIYSLVPVLAIERLYAIVLNNLGPLKQDFGYYWTTEKNAQPFMIMAWGNIVIYSIVLFIIEKNRKSVQSKNAKRSFGNYSELFKEIKAKSDVTEEALQMEKEVKSSHDYAVRIENVSRLFFNTEGKPIPAVNSVSLGVKKGSLFGFLGANGAGKTTLIRMITSLLPPSDGNIEIFGKDISEYNNPNLISICPQFNKHLINEMTVDEHFQLFGYLFEFDDDEVTKKRDALVKSLELDEIRDKPLNELSQGDVRKLAIALTFYGPSEIILLDEPTASLDPVARHSVQEMILENRGDKTFMLCTHLLSEAEFMCDMISIMVKGCVFTCGSPEMLSAKFGTDYKVDVMLSDERDVTADKCDKFFREKLPLANLSIVRPKARIYDIPASAIELSDLFMIMEEGKKGENGFVYYTCSSSSLERVFMEIVRMSEEAEEV